MTTPARLLLPAQSAATQAPSRPDLGLQEALGEFQKVLSAEQKVKLWSFNDVPDADSILAFTTELDNENGKRGSRCVASRLLSVLESIQQFSAIVDTFVSSSPKVAALVWGSVKVALLVRSPFKFSRSLADPTKAASNFSSYFDKLSLFLMEVRKQCPRYSEYQAIYLDSSSLQKALCDYYATIVTFCKEAVLAVQRTGIQQLARSLWKSFGTDFGSFECKIKSCKAEIDEEIRLALHQAAYEEQQFQLVERKSANKHRITAAKFRQRADVSFNEAQEWRMRRDRRALRKRRQHLLDSLSTYDFQQTLRQARKKCFQSTGQWLMDRSEWKGWLNHNESTVFCCSGIIGSGKTVLTANTISNLSQNPLHQTQIAYFFCQFDKAESLQATIILRALIRQLISVESVSSAVELRLTKMSEEHLWNEENDLISLFVEVLGERRLKLIILDGIDECTSPEQKMLLKLLSAILKASPALIKIFITCREATVREIQRCLPITHRVDMRCSQEVETFVSDAIDEKLREEKLIVGDPHLREEICASLVQGAKGMFLWVYLQIEDICSMDSDESIRQALRELPEDLSETFSRFLSRVVRHRKQEIVAKVFRCIAAAKRPLLLPELSEAIAVEPSQRYLVRESVVNDGHRLISHCEHLVIVDEEDESIQFPHHSVQEFLLGPARALATSCFHFGIADAEALLGIICATYLNFKDFKKDLIPRPKQRPEMTPEIILDTTLPNDFSRFTAKMVLKLRQGRNENTAHQPGIIKQLMRYAQDDSDRRGGEIFTQFLRRYSFLAYASEFWLLHWPGLKIGDTTASTDTPPSQNLWTSLLSSTNPLAWTPWTKEDWSSRNRVVTSWICHHGHQPLLQHVQGSAEMISTHEARFMMKCALQKPDLRIIYVLLNTVSSRNGEWNPLLLDAVNGGRLAEIDFFLRAGVDVNSGTGDSGSQTFLGAAIYPGGLNVVKKLLSAEADPNTRDGGEPPLHIALRKFELEIFEELLDAGADIHVLPKQSGNTAALRRAASQGFENTVNVLIGLGTPVNAPHWDDTPLQAAAAAGHRRIVEELIAAVPNVKPPRTFPRDSTPLEAAVLSGHREAAEALLKAGANYQSLLRRTLDSDNLEALELLLTAGADFQSEDVHPALRSLTDLAGHTGRQSLIDILVRKIADCRPHLDKCPFALHIAAAIGPWEAIEDLLLQPVAVDKRFPENPSTLRLWEEIYDNKELATALFDTQSYPGPLLASGGWTPLHAAVNGGSQRKVLLLLAAGAFPDAEVGNTGVNALHLAIQGENRDVVSMLLPAMAVFNAPPPRWSTIPFQMLHDEKPATNIDAHVGCPLIRTTPLYNAAAGTDEGVASSLLAQQAEGVWRKGRIWNASLHIAVWMDHRETVGILLAAGADINSSVPRTGLSYLHQAILGDKGGAVNCLLAAGADVELRNSSAAWTPLYVASSLGDYKMVRRLLGASAAVNFRSQTVQEAPLHRAVKLGRLAIINSLLAAGADINATSQTFSMTPLHAAILSGSWWKVRALLNHGAPIDEYAWIFRDTPLHTASLSGNLWLRDTLVAGGADVNRKCWSAAWSPLFLAAACGHEEIVRDLLTMASSVDAPSITFYGPPDPRRIRSDENEIHYQLNSHEARRRSSWLRALTPLQIASMKGHHGIVHRLIEAGAGSNTVAGSIKLTNNMDTELLLLKRLIVSHKLAGREATVSGPPILLIPPNFAQLLPSLRQEDVVPRAP